MKRTTHPHVKFFAALCLLLVAAMLTSCSGLHTIVAETNTLYRDTRTNSTYYVLPSSYEPISRGEEYGKLELSGVTYVLHTITGLHSDKWLCSVWGDVYCAEELSVAPFTDWSIRALHVCTNTALSLSELTIKPNALYTADTCQKAFSILQDTYRNATALTYPSYAVPTRVYTLRFEADNVPGLYYTMQLLEYGEDIYETLPDQTGTPVETNVGRTLLYDRYAGRCVAVDDFIFRLLDGEKVEDVLS